VVFRSAPEFRGAHLQQTASWFGLRILKSSLFCIMASYSRVDAAEFKPVDGSAKPSFTLQTTDSKDVSPTVFRGRTVIVHFFATWCEPCREELPALNRFLSRSVANASVIAISVAEPDSRVKRFFERTFVGFPVLLDRDGSVAKSWKISTLPTTYVLDANVKPTLVVEADFPWDTVDVEPVTGKLVKSTAEAIKPLSERSSDLGSGRNDHGL
jgi:peroxiredoxin